MPHSSNSEGKSETEESEPITVAISPNGQATIPKQFREKLGIEAPGKVTFKESDDGSIVVERVPSADEMKGFAARSGEAETETPASELLRQKRTQEKAEREQK